MSLKSNEPGRRRHAEAVSRAMKRLAETRQCPACGRKAALKTHLFGDGTGVKFCRWCKYEKGIGS